MFAFQIVTCGKVELKQGIKIRRVWNLESFDLKKKTFIEIIERKGREKGDFKF